MKSAAIASKALKAEEACAKDSAASPNTEEIFGKEDGDADVDVGEKGDDEGEEEETMLADEEVEAKACFSQSMNFRIKSSLNFAIDLSN